MILQFEYLLPEACCNRAGTALNSAFVVHDRETLSSPSTRRASVNKY